MINISQACFPGFPAKCTITFNKFFRCPLFSEFHICFHIQVLKTLAFNNLCFSGEGSP